MNVEPHNKSVPLLPVTASLSLWYLNWSVSEEDRGVIKIHYEFCTNGLIVHPKILNIKTHKTSHVWNARLPVFVGWLASFSSKWSYFFISVNSFVPRHLFGYFSDAEAYSRSVCLKYSNCAPRGKHRMTHKHITLSRGIPSWYHFSWEAIFLRYVRVSILFNNSTFPELERQ